MSDDLKALRTTVLLLQDWLDDGFLGWLHDDSECVELIREAPKNLASLESQNQALQERAEKAEAALKAYRCEGCGHPFQETAHIYGKRTCCPDCSHGPFVAALSPTQETDPDDDRRGGIYETSGYKRVLHPRPTQEADPE